MNNQFTNFGSATISTAVVNPTDLTLALTTGQGSLFPSPTGAQYFYIVITDSLTAPTKNEIVKVTNRTGDTITMTRALDGTIAQAWVAGNYFSLRWCNASIQDVLNSQSVVLDSTFRVQAVADTTKQFGFNLTGITTANTRLWTVPDFSDTFVGVNATQTLSNKTFVAPVLGVATATSVSATTFTGALVGNATTATTAGSVATNANLTGPITSAGNTTSVAAQTGTGSTFVMNTSPTLITPVLGAATGTSVSLSGQYTSTLAAGTAPLVIASTTLVPNLYVARAFVADSATTSANLTGPITSVGNATAVAAQTGTGSTFVMNTSPSLITPNIGAASGLSLSLLGNISSPAWLTGGLRIKGIPATFTDTTSSGTVVAAYTDVLGGNTITATSVTTFTNYITAFFNEPVQGPNVTFTNKWALGGASLRIGTSNPFTVTNSGAMAVAGTFNSLALSSFGGAFGAESLQVQPIASAVNSLSISGSITGNPILLTPAGTDANPPIRVALKGTGNFLVDGGSASVTNTLQVSCTGANGATILITGNGATTPSKYIRVLNGALDFVSHGYAAVIMSLSNAGTLTVNTNLSLSYNGTNAFVVPLSGQLAFNTAAIATTATTGFHCTVSGAGAPTGVPASIPTGQIPTYYDSTNNRIYFYNGAWRSVAVA